MQAVHMKKWDRYTANELGARDTRKEREKEILNLAMFSFANEFEGENTERANLVLWIEQMKKPVKPQKET